MKTWLSLPTRLLKKPYDRVFPLILLAVVLSLVSTGTSAVGH